MVHALSNKSYSYFERTAGDGNNYFVINRVNNYNTYNWPTKSPWYNLNVETAGKYDIFLPSQDTEFKWSVTVNPGTTSAEGTRYTSATTAVEEAGTYKAVTIPLTQGANTIRIEWDGSKDFANFQTFSIAPESATPVNFVGNTNTISEYSVSNAITTGTTSSGKISLAADKSITYKIVSDEATDVRLWWNSDVNASSAKFDLSVNGTAQKTDATASANIGKVSLAQGENIVVFTVKSGTLSNISKLYVVDAKIKLSTTERTNIHALSTTDGLSGEMKLNSVSDAYMEVRYKDNLQGLNRTPKYYLEVEEAGDYDIYLPSENTTFVWEIWVNEDPSKWAADSDVFVNTTVAEQGLYKAFTVHLNEGENFIYLAWNHDNSSGSGSFNKFTGFAIEKTPDPYLVTATVTGSVAEGLAVSADLSNHDGNEVMAIVAVYKVKNGVKRLVASDVDTITATTTAHSLATAAVAAEDGYTYEYKVFVWNASTYAPYPVKIN